jgi:hypothetical protein
VSEWGGYGNAPWYACTWRGVEVWRRKELYRECGSKAAGKAKYEQLHREWAQRKAGK